MKPARPSTWHFWAEGFTSQENQLFDTGLAGRARHRAMPFMKHFAHSPKAKTRHVVPYPVSSLNPLGAHVFLKDKKLPKGGNGLRRHQFHATCRASAQAPKLPGLNHAG
ncbi:hypothetical protein [Agrobacterium vacciniicorymbosi]|uniref:hypothetical protein n=1 Tax=Agrobacterium sp. BA1120 TaxID=3228927 RepID=UPI00336A62C1